MNLLLSADQTLVIESTGVTLRGTHPVLNGAPLENWTCDAVRSDNDHIELRYKSVALDGGVFGLNAAHADVRGQIWIQYWVEGLQEDLVLDSFGLRFEQVENLRQFLRNGYFSWDGSY